MPPHYEYMVPRSSRYILYPIRSLPADPRFLYDDLRLRDLPPLPRRDILRLIDMSFFASSFVTLGLRQISLSATRRLEHYNATAYQMEASRELVG